MQRPSFNNCFSNPIYQHHSYPFFDYKINTFPLISVSKSEIVFVFLYIRPTFSLTIHCKYTWFNTSAIKTLYHWRSFIIQRRCFNIQSRCFNIQRRCFNSCLGLSTFEPRSIHILLADSSHFVFLPSLCLHQHAARKSWCFF